MRAVELKEEKIFPIGLGTWQFGSREWAYGEEYARREAREILTRALELGVNFVDTAEIYGLGRSERIIGEVLKDVDRKPFVATKVFPVLAVGPIVRDRLRRSRARLKTDCIDLYQIHWPNPLIPPLWTLRELKKAQGEALIRHIGISNFSLRDWQMLEEHSEVEIVSNQVRFNLLDRRPLESGMIDWARDNGKVVIAYSPLAQGLLSGKYLPGERPGGFRRFRPEFSAENLKRLSPLIEVLKEVAEKHSANPSQVALAWVVSFENVIAIPGAASVAQLESNHGAASVELTKQEIEDLTQAARAVKLETGVSSRINIFR